MSIFKRIYYFFRSPKEHDLIELVVALPAYKRHKGQTGVIIHIYEHCDVYAVEFPSYSSHDSGIKHKSVVANVDRKQFRVISTNML